MKRIKLLKQKLHIEKTNVLTQKVSDCGTKCLMHVHLYENGELKEQSSLTVACFIAKILHIFVKSGLA